MFSIKKVAISITLLVSYTLSLTSAAFAAAPDPNVQGGAHGVMYITESTDGAIYVGDFESSPTAKTVFWQQAGTNVDEVAVTQSRIAWTSKNINSPLRSKIYISKVGTTAGTITTVTIPGNVVVVGLGADYFNERFYAATSDGKLYSVNGDGTDLNLALTHAPLANVSWGMWVDSYNSRIYYCEWNNIQGQTTNKGLWSASFSGASVSAPQNLVANFMTSCDGLGVDPVTQKVFAAGSNGVWATYDGSTAAPLSIPDVVSGARTDGAPSSMFVSHSTGKIYFTTEQHVYEVDYAGNSGLRVLYTNVAGRNSQGFENLAVFYGQTLATIDAVQLVTPPLSSTATSAPSAGQASAATVGAPTLAKTGLFAEYQAMAAVSLMLTGAVLLTTIRRKKSTR